MRHAANNSLSPSRSFRVTNKREPSVLTDQSCHCGEARCCGLTPYPQQYAFQYLFVSRKHCSHACPTHRHTDHAECNICSKGMHLFTASRRLGPIICKQSQSNFGRAASPPLTAENMQLCHKVPIGYTRMLHSYLQLICPFPFDDLHPI